MFVGTPASVRLLNPYHFTLQVQDVNEAPTNITPTVASVAENSADGTVVANLSAIDPEGNSISYGIAGSDGGRFAVVGNQIRVAHGQLLDFETQSTHMINIIATDSHGAQSVQAVAVNLADQAEAFTINGTASSDFLTGTNGADRIGGGVGDDFISAGKGNDYIDGGAGADNMAGGAGNDTYIVDNVGDVITENNGGGGGTDTVISSLSSYVLSGNLENLINSGSAAVFTGFGNGSANILSGGAAIDNLYGAGGNDLLIGNSGSDNLDGGSGNDEIYGGLGNDNLWGNAGDDILDGGAGNDFYGTALGNDVIVLRPGFGNDSVNLFDADASGGQDLIDVKQFGITAANFDSHVTIANAGADTLITIDHDPSQTIRLKGLGDSTMIDKTDFALLGA